MTEGTVAELTTNTGSRVRVRTPQAPRLRELLTSRGVVTDLDAPDEVVARDVTPEEVGAAVAAAGLVVYEMTVERRNLEDAFLELTGTDGRPS